MTNKPIAEGSFADVFLTNDNTVIKRINVSKILRKKTGLTVQLIKDYIKSEIYILRELEHPNIIKYIHSEKLKTGVYDVHLEYCKYGDLFHILKSPDKFTEFRNPWSGFTGEFLESFIRQMCNALSYFHNYSLIHRDIKPHNILLNESMTFKLADFGFSCCDLGNIKLTEYEKKTLTIVERKYFTKSGTPYYIAPEIYSENYNYTGVSDMWSLGVTIYELYFNELPFPTLKTFNELSSYLQNENSQLIIHDKIISSSASITIKRILTGLLVLNPKDRLSISDVLLLLNSEGITEPVEDPEQANIPEDPEQANIPEDPEQANIPEDPEDDNEMYSTFIDNNFSKSFSKWLKENEN